MVNYVRLNSKGNAKNALNEILRDRANKADLRFVVYDLAENHVLCASDEGGPSAVAKYALSGETANAIKRDATNGFPIAVLAYNLRANEVYLLDAVPEIAVANCLLLCVMNILVGVADSLGAFAPTRAFEESKQCTENYVTAQPRPKTKAVRDAQTGRFVRLEEDHSDSVEHRFRLGGRRLI